MYWFCVLASLIVSVSAISPLSIKGNKFYDGNGTQIFFKGNRADIGLRFANQEALHINGLRQIHSLTQHNVNSMPR